MGLHARLRKLWKHPKKIEGYQAKLIQYRREPATVRLEKPTRLDRARSLGYKAKQGYIVARQRVMRGGRKREHFAGGRRPKTYRFAQVVSQNYRWVAEIRAQKKFPNCEVLNSYEVGRDGIYFWYEVILLDRSHPSIKSSKETAWVSERTNKGRVYRGLTGAGKKSRGLYRKGRGAEKIRPSLRANKRRSK
ncbi:50S ribosomal protein L15e [Candidatus Woesearchaeota archaeon]|nr:50S ribosomal protein L15e [Candidatus Woesearchaeota archaeon]